MHAKTILLLALCIGLAAVTAVSASDNYAGGEIVLGGAGPRQITQVATTEQVPTAAGTTAAGLQPVAPSGSVSVTSSPAGATILVDGVQRGIAPATIPGLLAGTHTVQLTLDGYQDSSSTVTITAGQTQTLTVTLQPAAGASAAGASAPAGKRSPGFEGICGLAAIGAVLCVRTLSR